MSNYLQIELGKKLRGLKFNQLALEEFVKLVPTSEDNKFDWTNSNGFTAYACVYAGLVGNAVVKREDVTYNLEEVSDWVDDAKDDDIKKACELFFESQHYKKLLEKFNDKIRSMSNEEVKEEEDKKKAVVT